MAPGSCLGAERLGAAGRGEPSREEQVWEMPGRPGDQALEKSRRLWRRDRRTQERAGRAAPDNSKGEASLP